MLFALSLVVLVAVSGQPARSRTAVGSGWLEKIAILPFVEFCGGSGGQVGNSEYCEGG